MDLGTKLFTLMRGRKVGTDGHGNRYYEERRAPRGRRRRRWVLYKGGKREASLVPPEWHGWLHRTFKDTPKDDPLPHKAWEKPHHDNLSGTAEAYHPAGSMLRAQPVERADYEAWQP